MHPLSTVMAVSPSFRADLHCHTSCSDGSFTPLELINHAKELGLQGLSITDHDTIDAYETAIPAAKEAGIQLGTGVELSCTYKDISVHILGYDFLLTSLELRTFCQKHRNRRLHRNRAILEKLAHFKMPIAETELLKKGEEEKTIGRPHIAELMVKKGYVSSIKEAFMLYLGEGKLCYDPGEAFSIEETIALIHTAKGKAFLAHPHLLIGGAWIRGLLELPFDGIECYYARSTPDKNKRWLKIAKEKGRLISGGSDFHGVMKPYISLGISWVDEENFHKIFQHLPSY